MVIPAVPTSNEEETPLGSAAIASGNTTLVVSGEDSVSGSPEEMSATTDDRSLEPEHQDPRLMRPDQNHDGDDCFGIADERCRGGARPPDETPIGADPIPAIAISDLASFSPDTVIPVSEPLGVGIVGLPTNFVAAASVHVRTGTLFDLPLTVRFTPVGYDFDYGDGTASSAATGGQTWASLGQAQFTPTSTSHIYRERGTYDARVTVQYTAEVDLGTGWFPVAGQLTIAGPTQQIRIFEAHTGLVARTCAEQPAAPGC